MNTPNLLLPRNPNSGFGNAFLLFLDWTVDYLVPFVIFLAWTIHHSVPFFIFLAWTIDHAVCCVGFRSHRSCHDSLLISGPAVRETGWAAKPALLRRFGNDNFLHFGGGGQIRLRRSGLSEREAFDAEKNTIAVLAAQPARPLYRKMP